MNADEPMPGLLDPAPVLTAGDGQPYMHAGFVAAYLRMIAEAMRDYEEDEPTPAELALMLDLEANAVDVRAIGATRFGP